MNNLAGNEYEELITDLEKLLNTMYVYKNDFSITNGNLHIGTCINYADLLEMRDEFLNELIYTIIEYVYSSTKQEKLIKKFKTGRNISAAYSKLFQHSKSKFRKSSLQGQFSELLIFNLLQYYYNAVPLLRKMAITTNPELERNGADAIHIAKENDKYLIYLAEAKTYNRNNSASGLKEALKDATKDMINKHYIRHREELNLYVYDDFISKDFEEIAENYKEGSFSGNYEVHMVCIVSYDFKSDIDLSTRDTALQSMIDDIQKGTTNIMTSKAFKGIPTHLLSRIHYIIFPVKDLENLIEKFTEKLRG
ncbi:DUF1837 domain-containing protein [Exiguobacterium sp. s16]|uniref:HamA C-terminal domain-containing protein n=1 Tax=Exiguobacterium sp. s16 TaxID=2751237 RepID=UPI001BE78398|nr:DUF1837 domain-containing protein [Exiguobacterium sp. s16]